MKLLLDTHIFLWALLEPERLSQPVADALEDADNELWLSPVSLWESLLLAEKGRVVLEPDPESWLRTKVRAVGVRSAPLNTDVAYASRRLALEHKDPADRFIAATALVYDLTLVTADSRLVSLTSPRVLPN